MISITENIGDFTKTDSKVQYLQGKKVLIKYGGNAMLDEKQKHNIIANICYLKTAGVFPVIVHGGGPVIANLLDEVNIESEFIHGHRYTDKLALKYVEMALSGNVNKDLVSLIHRHNCKAIGISGKDGKTVIAQKKTDIDLGQVGVVKSVDPTLINLLLRADYIPVISPISAGEDGEDYNINADLFAGHVAGSLGCEDYLVLTNVDGLQDDTGSLITHTNTLELKGELQSVIRGGMIPKIASCITALHTGVKNVHVINGTVHNIILKQLLTDDSFGTKITR